MRHVSRTHRVALDWLFGWLDFDYKIGYVDTKNELVCWHAHQKKFHAWWVELFVRSKSWISRCFCSEFPWKTEHHVEESSGKKDGRRVCGGKSNPASLRSRSLSANQSPTLDSGTSYSPGNYRLGWNSDFTGAERSVRDRVENSRSRSRVWHKGENPFPSTQKSDKQEIKLCETGVRRTETAYRGRSWSTTIFKSLTIYTLKKFSR